MEKNVSLKVNGRIYKVQTSIDTLLVDVLREQLHLMGTKKRCLSGECGVCTVLLDGKAVNSCLILAVEAEGKEIVTIEGLESDGGLTKVQQAFVDKGAIQCGFCTPGMVMSAEGLLRDKPDPTEAEIREAIAGNICRCTGYHKIVDAIREASKIDER